MYRAKAKSIVQAVTRSENAGHSLAGSFFSSQANRGTKIQKHLSFVEWAEMTQDAREASRTRWTLQQFGSIREAVRRGSYS